MFEIKILKRVPVRVQINTKQPQVSLTPITNARVWGSKDIKQLQDSKTELLTTNPMKTNFQTALISAVFPFLVQGKVLERT